MANHFYGFFGELEARTESTIAQGGARWFECGWMWLGGYLIDVGGLGCWLAEG